MIRYQYLVLFPFLTLIHFQIIPEFIFEKRKFGRHLSLFLENVLWDASGAETSSSKVIDGVIYTVGRKYDALGRIKEVAYHDGVSKTVYGYNRKK